MGGKHSRDKGARSERQLRDELRRHGWTDVVRVPLSGAVKSRNEYQDDVAGRPPGWATEIRFENKARRAGFDKIYTLVPPSVDYVAFNDMVNGGAAVISLDPNKILDVASRVGLRDISTFDPKVQKVLRNVLKKCRDWIGNAQVLSLKQDRCPFIFIRYYS
jgi:Holliday junction resolvase